MWKREILEGFEERLKNIGVFAPLLELKNKKKYPYPMVELGMATLLFILEDMLLGEKNSTYHHISLFLKDLIEANYHDELTYEEALQLTYYLVRDGLMNGGRPHSFSYQDYGTFEEKEFRFHLVELEYYQVKDKIIRLKLSPMGIELLFKSKEMYNELQVSISQLYLRIQIQKGVFHGALRSVEELSLAVRNEKEKIKELEERIIRDVLQVAREKELEERLRRIHEQLIREKEVFSQLQDLMDYTLKEYREGRIGKKEEEAIVKMMKVRKRLHDIIAEHESLFTDKIQIQRLMNESIETMIINAFSTKINFETEILTPFLRHRKGPDALKKLLDPLFPPKIPSFFHPGLIFQEQSLKGEGKKQKEELINVEEEFLRQEEEKERQIRKKREENLKNYLKLLLEPLVTTDKVTIGEILTKLERKDKDSFLSLIENLDFYPFLIRLHQLGTIPLLKREEVEGSFLDELPWLLVQVVEDNRDLQKLPSFELVATQDTLRLPNGYVISDFIIKGGSHHGMG